MSFGDFLAEGQAVLANLHVRTIGPDGSLSEGTRPPLIFSCSIIEGLHDNLSALLKAMAEVGLDTDALPPPGQSVPSWNAGPSVADLQGPYICTAFGFYEPDPSKAGAVALVGISSVGQEGEHSADYLVAHRTVLALQEGVAKVVARIRAKDFRSLR